MNAALARAPWYVIGVLLVAASPVARAAEPGNSQEGDSRSPTYNGPLVEAPEHINPNVARDFSPPHLNRPFGHPRYLDPYRLDPPRWSREHGFNRATDFGAYRRYYRDYYSYRYGTGHDRYGYDDAVERAYRQRLEDGKFHAEFLDQAQRGMTAYQRAISSADAAFREGHYAVAARDYILAARLNQGDPIARLNGAHAQVALGRFHEAVALLRRAFELEPRIALMPLNLRDAYAHPRDFIMHLEAVADASRSQPQDAELAILLAYYSHFSGDSTAAAEAITRAAGLRSGDRLLDTLKEAILATQPAAHSRNSAPRPSAINREKRD